MDDDVDPGPYVAPNNMNPRSRGRARGRGWRSASAQRVHPPADAQPRIGQFANPQNFDDVPWQPHLRRGGRAGFMNANNNRAHAGMPQNIALAPRGQHFNQLRSHSHNRNFDNHQPPNQRRNFDNNQPPNQRRNFDNNQPPNQRRNFDNNQPPNQRRNFDNNQPPNQRRNFDNNQKNCRTKYIGFKRLEEIAQSESQDALAKLMESKAVFIELLQSPIERLDVFVLIIACMAKVCQSSFDELKLSLLMDTCNSNFIVSLKSFLMELPYPQAKAANNMYWKDQDGFWRNLIVFFESIILTSPTLALNKCRSLVDATSTACLDGLKERHAFNLPAEYASKLKELRERMSNFEKMKEVGHNSRKKLQAEDGAPPEDFRELSIMPTREDLLQRKAYVRPNIVDGAYENVEHYLDVQFRLLREDCFGPLRDGLSQYIEDPKRRKYDHIRIFHNVKFVKPYVSQTKIGSLVQIDMRSNTNFKRINWANSKRFIYGSLVLFTKDNCKSFIAGTILDRDEKYLNEGMIPVSLMETEFNERLYNEDDVYTMIESEVYFEPYYHVLRALQDPTFPDHIAMKQYIVHVNPEAKHPAYLNPDKEFKVVVNRDRERSSPSEDSSAEDNELNHLSNAIVKFTVLQDETWPGKDTLQLNETQLEAYKLALTHELAVIQGPPGTGKTYLGIRVAKTLFQNLKNELPGCLMLVICYTNHALDQFLEALLKVTRSIVRIGGQSRNEAMEPINLKNLRRNISIRCNSYRVYVDQKMELKQTVSEFQQAMVHLDTLINGVIKCTMLYVIPEIDLLRRFYNHSGSDPDPLYKWLFEHVEDYYDNDIEPLLKDENLTSNVFGDLEKETRKRTGVQLDDRDNNESEQVTFRASIATFSLEGVNTILRELIANFKACRDPREQYNIRLDIQALNARKHLFNDMSQYRLRRIETQITDRTNFNRFSPMDRWTLYFTWIQDLVTEKKNEIGELQGRLNTVTMAYEEARMLLDMQVLQDRRIIGMTTSGAAKMRKLLQTLAPPIVIVEEAAEVLEQHIVTSLTKACQHLILIGDHQQLRPSASHMKLATHYRLEVSLFERMIRNGMRSRRLGVQHRMRPELAALVCPHIYRELHNHPSVHDFPDVLAITTNLFFLTHDHKEQEVIENMSRTNHKEADLVLVLANYLMQQGYTADDVTILAAYKGQMFYMRKESDQYTHLKGVKITVVDNYQGEESKIILLSLVRNNDDNKIGFLGTPNRVCVALSRAKIGFYMFGNINTLKANSELWKNIATTLENGNSLGTSLTLKCQNHPNNLTEVSKVEDFLQVPEGGCKEMCDAVLRRCGHRCQLRCHGYDRDHVSGLTACPRKCERILCELGHVCPKKCAEDCGPCKRKLTKTLPCGHDKSMFCHLEPDDPSVKCFVSVDVVLPDCGHKVQKMCYLDVELVPCSVKCEYRVEKCGHSCLRVCHVKNDPDHEKYLCMKPCAKAKLGCTAGLEGDLADHQCTLKCYETCEKCEVQVTKRRSTCTHKKLVSCNTNIDKVPCNKNCNKKLATCDHFCKKKCSEPCGNCMEMIQKEIPECKHQIRIMCKMEPTRSLCTNKCERTMKCGHRCEGVCGVECDPSACGVASSRAVLARCGHSVTLPCRLAALPAEKLSDEMVAAICTAACGAELACGHVCGGGCGPCRQRRLHAPCTQRCGRDNICGHQCQEPCNQICPPCTKQCEVQCQHSRCRKLCGAPCTSCKEKCGRRCPHGGACGRTCGAACARAPCDEPCARLQRCGHACRGLCGEPCPPVCRLCAPDRFPRDFLGDEFDDDARFILLQDCGHIMEVDNMDSMMLGDSETVEIRKCPFCRKPIINTGRYKDLVNKIFKEEINPIKTRLYGTAKEIELKKTELITKISEFKSKYLNVLKADKNIKVVYLNLQAVAKTAKKVSKLQLDMESICLNILDMIAECYKKFIDSKLTEFKSELAKQTEMLCQVFTFKVKAGVVFKVSEQQQKDMGCEIKRMNSIVQLAKLTNHVSYDSVKKLSHVEPKYVAAKQAVFSWTVFNENNAMAALKDLQEAMKLSGIVTKQERAMIVQAIGLKAGHWYKCPNGHFYCIGECGGATQESKCPECGARIGGRNHALTAGNTHAPEMDGSPYAAWSTEYNNMANFRLD